jgi:two-component system, sensor histidine kinase and response regulator
MTEDDRRTVLVIDDTPEDIAVLSEVLRSDYRVRAATEHEAAITIARSSEPPDLILLDIMMPGIDGYQLCRELKADALTRDIPVIFVTVKGAVENEAAGFDVGCVDYIIKPVNPLLVMARVKAHVDLKLAREDLVRQNDILRENARLREEVEAIGRHDLKNPLMIVMNIPQVLMADANLSESQRSLLKMVEEAGQRMLGMINLNIDMYKMEEGTYQLQPTAVNILQSIERIKSTLKKPMEDKGVGLRVALPDQPPAAPGAPLSEHDSFIAMGEELLLYSMLANLVKNAVEASPDGGEIAIALREQEMAVITIHNRGAIPESIRGRFFHKFTTAGKERGTGLGAYSAKLIAKTLRGTIGVETSDEAGTTITIRLPKA